MFIKRKNFESLQRENAELAAKLDKGNLALQEMTERNERRGQRIIKLEKELAKASYDFSVQKKIADDNIARVLELEQQVSKRDSKTGRFTKK